VLAGYFSAFVSIVGTAFLFLLATGVSLGAGIFASRLSNSGMYGVVSLLASLALFVGVGWIPGWYGMILFVLAGGTIMAATGLISGDN